MASLLSWNVRGLRCNLCDVKTLINTHQPVCFALQETLLKYDSNFNVNRYTSVRKDLISENRPHGGVAILISQNYPFHTLTLNTELQAVAVQVQTRKLVTVCSLYIPPNQSIDQKILDDLIEQLPEPYIILGDLNGHSPMWGNSNTNPRGKQIEKLIDDHSICLLNNRENTYFHEPSGSFHALDLALCSPSIFTSLSFSVENNLYNSDHFPLIVTLSDQYSCTNERPVNYRLDKADWDTFMILSSLNFDMINTSNIDEATSNVTEAIIKAANFSIPKTGTKPPKFFKPWWNSQCRQTYKDQRKAWDTFRSDPTQENLIAFKRARANARQTRKRSQRECWENYVSSISPSTNSKTVWNKIKKISGTYNNRQPIALGLNGNILASLKDIANEMGASFASVSSANNYTEPFLSYRNQIQKKKIDFRTTSNYEYNSDLTLNELQYALSKTNNSSAGPDGIPYAMIKHLSDESLIVLLTLYNRIWRDNVFPSSWRRAIVIPIIKPGKDPSNPSNYRPIALTNCLCKLLEKIVNNRLTYYLETNNLISPLQSGFRKGRSTTDNILLLETSIRNAFLRRNHLVSIFFDLNKAYDRTWRYGIISDLFNLNLRGNLPNFIPNFLNNRSFQVKILNTLSDDFYQEEGVPQGSVLSVTLFNIKINEILKQLPPSVKGCLYVDDFTVWCQGRDMRYIERQLQITVKNIEKWCNKNGFELSEEKTKCIHFCRRRNLHPDPELYIKNKLIPISDNIKYLGVILDTKLSFKPHIQYIRDKCLKSLNILKVLSNTFWGAHRSSMLSIYRTIVRSRLDYGAIIYSAARISTLGKLNPIHHQALRLCSGAFRTSPVHSLYTDCHEPSLYFRRSYLAIKYYFNLKSKNLEPYNNILRDQYTFLYQARPTCTLPFGMRVRQLMEEWNVGDVSVTTSDCSAFPPWQDISFHFENPFNHFNKNEINNTVLKQIYQNFKSNYRNYHYIYTDGSKADNAGYVGCALTCDHFIKSYRLHNMFSIFSAELQAIHYALLHIQMHNLKKSIIFTDSLSSLQSLASLNLQSHALISKILKLHNYLSCKGYKIIFSYVPSHTGIKGNEIADVAAKSASNLSNDPIPINDISTSVRSIMIKNWQNQWSREIHNKLFSVKPNLGVWKCQHSRRDSVILTRLRIGHTRLTHQHLLKGEDPPQCARCDVPLSVHHVLIDCPALNHLRSQIFNNDFNLTVLIGPHPHPNLFQYLHLINIYNLL